MIYLLDTKVLSETMKPQSAAGGASWMRAQPLRSMYTTAICQAESLAGIAIPPAGRRRSEWEAMARATFRKAFEGRILAFGGDHVTTGRVGNSIMTSWTLDDLRRLDLKYAKEGMHFHQRPFRAAMELLGSNFVIDVGGNSEVKRIMNDYAALVPEVDASWPGAGIGLAASVDQVRKLILPVVFGHVLLQPWQMAGFSCAEEWWIWCRQDQAIAGEVALAIADLHDFINGLNEVEQANPAATKFWHMARSNLQDLANALPTLFSHDSVIQPICMVAELSMKAVLVRDGADPDSFRKGKDGHNLSSLARRMADGRPHRDDQRVQAIVGALPPYVESRYKPVGLKRLPAVKLALGVQFIAASSLRRMAGADLALQMETDEWPGPRQPFTI